MATSNTEKKTPPTRLKLRNVRFSYCNLFKARALDEKSAPRFSVSLLIPKTDTTTVAAIKTAMGEALRAKWPDPAKRPTKLHNPLRDGDAEKPGDAAYAGHWFLNAASPADQPPLVVDAKLNKVSDHSQWVSGDYGIASVDFYPFDKAGNRGVAVGLRVVQFLAKGEALTGRGNLMDDVEVEEVGGETTADDPFA